MNKNIKYESLEKKSECFEKSIKKELSKYLIKSAIKKRPSNREIWGKYNKKFLGGKINWIFLK